MIRFSLRIPDDVHRRVKALAERERRSINEQIVRMLETHPEVMEMATTERLTPEQAWEGFVGRQTPAELLQHYVEDGITDIDEMARRYVADIPAMLDVEADDLPEGLADLLADYIRQHVDLCEICDANGQAAAATKRVLGRDACPKCAAELETNLRIGPAIWVVDVRNPWPDTDPVADDPAADYGTVDYGDFTLGYRDRAAAERYAAQVGAEVHEGFIVEVVGDDEGQALDAAAIEWVAFDNVIGVAWPHSDLDGLRRRLLYGAEA